jgi:hypothetical protein
MQNVFFVESRRRQPSMLRCGIIGGYRPLAFIGVGARD